jgi:hypothetical protein
MTRVPTGSVHQADLEKDVARAIRKLGKDVVRVTYSLGEDSTGDPSINFRIVISDAASRRDRLGETARRIVDIFYDELQPQEKWGLLPYFSFRSKTEQDGRNDPEWS